MPAGLGKDGGRESEAEEDQADDATEDGVDVAAATKISAPLQSVLRRADSLDAEVDDLHRRWVGQGLLRLDRDEERESQNAHCEQNVIVSFGFNEARWEGTHSRSG